MGKQGVFLGKIETKRALHQQRNRTLGGQVVLVWTCGPRVRFTTHDEEPRFGDAHDCMLAGELHTEIVEGEFIDTIIPLRHRGSKELAEMAALTAANRAYREQLSRNYRFKHRLLDLEGSS